MIKKHIKIWQEYDSFHQQMSLTLKEDTSEVLRLYDAENCSLQKVYQKYLESFGRW
jgi:hypothetical protein